MNRVKVAIIDSGVNQNHPHVGKVTGGLGFRVEGDKIIREEQYADCLGHGTAIAGIIRAKAPAAEIYALRVFEKTLMAFPSVVAAAIYEAMELGCQVINMSLTMWDTTHLKVLEKACSDAYVQGCVLLAAAGTGSKPAWPADWPTVIGVYGDDECGWEQLVVNEQPQVTIGAHPYPRPLPGRPQQHNLKGNSFACGHVSGLVANYFAGGEDAIGFQKVVNLLIKRRHMHVSKNIEN